jgi:hypothetical protein
MTHDEIIAIIQAHKDGKQLQLRYQGKWVDCMKDPALLSVLADLSKGYTIRVKPEPKRIYVPLAHSGGLVKRYYETLAELRAEWPSGEYKEFTEVVR